MGTVSIVGQPLPSIPWQQRPAGDKGVMWRYDHNPIIRRDQLTRSNSIFNSAVVPFEGAFAGVFRSDDTARHMDIHAGRSKNAIDWDIADDPIAFVCDDPEVKMCDYKYDPRVVWIEDRYYVSWCTGYHGPTIGMGYTNDFKVFYQMENAFLPFNRNGVLFPRKISGAYAMLSRPSDNGHTPFGDIFYSESPDLTFWGRHRHVMRPERGWECTKIGPGPTPIETSEGWLLIYHGVNNSCNGLVYSAGVALLDLDQPWKVIARAGHYTLNPRTLYECVGDVPNVVFPVSALCDAETGRLAIYYGAADTVVGLAFSTVDLLVEFAKTS